MANLKTLQLYADKCAVKLGIDVKPVLRWHLSDDMCQMKSYTYAHCHIKDNHGFPRGTICLHKGIPVWHKVSWWHNTIAHEVTHLAVKSNHNTPTFDRRMVTLGVANLNERLNARSSMKGHHHIWMIGRGKQGYFKECHACHKRVYK